jgi:hypothetical protein
MNKHNEILTNKIKDFKQVNFVILVQLRVTSFTRFGSYQLRSDRSLSSFVAEQ